MYNYKDFKDNYMLLNSKIDPSIPVGSDEYKELTTKVRQAIAYFRLDKREAPEYGPSALKTMNQTQGPALHLTGESFSDYKTFGYLHDSLPTSVKQGLRNLTESKNISAGEIVNSAQMDLVQSNLERVQKQHIKNYQDISKNNALAHFGSFPEKYPKKEARTNSERLRKRAATLIKGGSLKDRLDAHKAKSGSSLFKAYNGSHSSPILRKESNSIEGIRKEVDRFNFVQSQNNIKLPQRGKPYQPSEANFPNTQGFSAEEIKSNQITQDLNALKHNDAINKTLGHTFGKNPADLNKISTNSNFLNSNGYGFTSYSSSSSDTSKAAIRANNDRLTGAYNKAIEDNNVGSRYKKALSSSDIQSKLNSYSTTTAGQSNLDRVTQRRQQLEEANKNRLMRNTARFNNELLSEKFKETAKNSYLNPSSQIRKMVNNLASSLPNYQSDSIAASLNGIATKETKSSYIDRFSRKIVDTINPNNNIVIDENKKYVEGALRQYEGYNRISGQSMNIDRMSEMSPNQIQKWKEMHREETSKYVRQIGGNIDPFDNMVEDKFGNYRPNEYTSKEGLDKLSRQMSGHRDELNWIDERLNSLNNQSSNSIISERGTSNNRYSSFFGATNREQTSRSEFEQLVSRKRELQDRLNKFDLGYTGEHINSDFTGPLREGEARPIIPASSPMGPNYTKDSFRPVYGTTGYGLGFKNAMAASGGEHLARFAYFATPFGTGSGRQALMEGAGILNRSQRLQASQARGFAKLGYAAVPATALGMVLMDMHEGKGPSEIAGDIFSMGTALHGWRMGSSLGGAAGSLLGKPGKFIGLGLGGVSGLIGGLVAGQALVSGISDAMSNDSQIRSYAKKAGTKEMYAHTPETRQTLTARGAALQKLARSGLNDRGLLLGNEATVLKGGM